MNSGTPHRRVLIVGGGGRELALAWKIASSPLVEEVICAPGNAGTLSVGRNVDVAANDIDGLVALARSEGVGLVVIGPEDPLVGGLADRLRAEDILLSLKPIILVPAFLFFGGQGNNIENLFFGDRLTQVVKGV